MEGYYLTWKCDKSHCDTIQAVMKEEFFDLTGRVPDYFDYAENVLVIKKSENKAKKQR
jgi:hypothetical protein